MTGPQTEILADILEEARRLLIDARKDRIPIRLLGGVAIRLQLPDAPSPAFVRPYNDIDLVTLKGSGRTVTDFLQSRGYEPSRQFNATNGHRRLLFDDTSHDRRIDVFVGEFEMCHRIPIKDRFAVTDDYLPLAELLLTKLQIVELNSKDRADVATLLYHYDLGEVDDATINARRIAALCAVDWGLWRTLRTNVERVDAGLCETALSPEQQGFVRDRLERLWERVEAEPKSRKWKLRNRVGDRVCWYELPDEVDA